MTFIPQPASAEFNVIADIEKKIESFQNQLRYPKKNSSDWQEEVGRLGSLLYVGSLSQSIPDEVYIKAIALLRFAQLIGVKATQKRDINPARFRDRRPPAMSIFEQEELIAPTIHVLSSLRVGWCAEFISETIRSVDIDKKTISIFGKWAQKNEFTAEDFLLTFSGKKILESEWKKLTGNLLKELSLQLAAVRWGSPDSAVKDFAKSIVVIAEFSLLPNLSKSQRKTILNLIPVIERRVRETYPFVLIQGDFVIAINALRKIFPKAEYPKEIKPTISNLSVVTASFLGFLMSKAEMVTIDISRSLLPYWQLAYPDFLDQLGKAQTWSPGLKVIKDTSLANEHADLESLSSSIYAKLLPDWFNFLAGKGGDPVLSGLNKLLLDAATINGVEFLGVAGDVCPFDPVLHSLQDDSRAVQTSVKIARPAIIFRRSRDNYRVLVKAIVSIV